MGTRSGLDGQLGIVAETGYGVAGVPVRFLEFDSEGFELVPTWIEGEGIRAGRKFRRDSRVGVSRRDVNGKLELKTPNKGLGLLIRQMLGSSATATVIGSTTAYQQIHTPGDLYGRSLTIQVGRPEPGTGIIRPFTFTGCKCTQWELSVADGEHVKLSTTWDGRDEDTAAPLAAAVYPASTGVFNFAHATLKLGGTAATSGTPPQLAVTGGTAIATVVNSVTIRGENSMAVERYGVGNGGLKAEPLENDYPTVTGSLDAEFSKTELYDLFKAGGSVTFELAFAYGDAGGGNPFLLSVTAPKVRLKKASPQVGGPGVVRMSTDFEVYDDEVNAPLQIKIVSTDVGL